MTEEILQKADDFFIDKNYKTALQFYSNILSQNPDDQDAQIGLLLTDMALNDNEEKAQTLFDYYIIIKDQDIDIAYDTINDLINEEEINAMEDKINAMDGISYKDFQDILLQNKDNIKQTLNNIIFSTKLIITSKKEFLDFIVLLLKYNFDHMILNYLDNFILTFGARETSIDIANTISSIKDNT